MILIWSNLVLATTEGDALLNQVDAVSRLNSAEMSLQLKVLKANGSNVERSLQIWQAENDARLVRLTAPSRLKGVGLLVSSDEQLHMFLPQYPPSRRVMGSSRADSFMGTDFAIDDLARLSYAQNYHAEIKSQSSDRTVLTLTPKEKDGQMGELHIDTDNRILQHIHFTQKGEVDRDIKMRDYRQIDGVWLAHEVEVTDNKTQRKTIGTLKEVQINQPIPPETFTLQFLENP
ncbi:MAG: outer membrane lipoprotein-sorting protein [Myxococcota bacterium]|nr:outer membrane lipoprotein-sorting protein [Myxococcota bacterium]MEC8379336.1 outer membrane lipoprotein-sorting protein [Myxococcota bacterium]